MSEGARKVQDRLQCGLSKGPLILFGVRAQHTYKMSHLMTKPTKWHICLAKTQINLGSQRRLIRLGRLVSSRGGSNEVCYQERLG